MTVIYNLDTVISNKFNLDKAPIAMYAYSHVLLDLSLSFNYFRSLFETMNGTKSPNINSVAKK